MKAGRPAEMDEGLLPSGRLKSFALVTSCQSSASANTPRRHGQRPVHGLISLPSRAKSDGHRNYLPGCLPPCADWKSIFTGACADAETAVSTGRPKPCGPKWATSVGMGRQLPDTPINAGRCTQIAFGCAGCHTNVHLHRIRATEPAFHAEAGIESGRDPNLIPPLTRPPGYI